jgi:hypothetical protein
MIGKATGSCGAQKPWRNFSVQHLVPVASLVVFSIAAFGTVRREVHLRHLCTCSSQSCSSQSRPQHLAILHDKPPQNLPNSRVGFSLSFLWGQPRTATTGNACLIGSCRYGPQSTFDFLPSIVDQSENGPQAPWPAVMKVFFPDQTLTDRQPGKLCLRAKHEFISTESESAVSHQITSIVHHPLLHSLMGLAKQTFHHRTQRSRNDKVGWHKLSMMHVSSGSSPALGLNLARLATRAHPNQPDGHSIWASPKSGLPVTERRHAGLVIDGCLTTSLQLPPSQLRIS